MQGNYLLDSLPADAFERLRPHFEQLQLPTDRNIFNHGDLLEYVYFPLDSVFNLFMTMEDGTTLESGMIGREGMIGLPAFFGVNTFFNHARILAARTTLRIKAQIIKREFEQNCFLQRLFLRYAHAFFVQNSQTSACNQIHQMEARLCRWLLLMRAKINSNQIIVTQEFIARMLGTHRPYVTTVIGLLQKQRTIDCSRGIIEIINHRILEECCCECYPIIQNEFSFLSKPTIG